MTDNMKSDDQAILRELTRLNAHEVYMAPETNEEVAEEPKTAPVGDELLEFLARTPEEIGMEEVVKAQRRPYYLLDWEDILAQEKNRHLMYDSNQPIEIFFQNILEYVTEYVTNDVLRKFYTKILTVADVKHLLPVGLLPSYIGKCYGGLQVTDGKSFKDFMYLTCRDIFEMIKETGFAQKLDTYGELTGVYSPQLKKVLQRCAFPGERDNPDLKVKDIHIPGQLFCARVITGMEGLEGLNFKCIPMAELFSSNHLTKKLIKKKVVNTPFGITSGFEAWYKSVDEMFDDKRRRRQLAFIFYFQRLLAILKDNRELTIVFNRIANIASMDNSEPEIEKFVARVNRLRLAGPLKTYTLAELQLKEPDERIGRLRETPPAQGFSRDVRYTNNNNGDTNNVNTGTANVNTGNGNQRRRPLNSGFEPGNHQNRKKRPKQGPPPARFPLLPRGNGYTYPYPAAKPLVLNGHLWCSHCGGGHSLGNHDWIDGELVHRRARGRYEKLDRKYNQYVRQ